MLLPLAIALTAIVLLTLRLLYVLPSTNPTPPPPPSMRRKHLMILLGSGGHTAEMLLLLSNSLPAPNLYKRTYVYTTGDALSLQKAVAFEQTLSSAPIHAVSIPRARRVGQSWLTTPWSSILCILGCVRAFSAREVPDVVLTNGPGSAVFMILIALVGRFLGMCGTRTVYVESFARVKTLSLSGKLLYPCVDRFLVQWPGLKVGRPRAEYRGVLVL